MGHGKCEILVLVEKLKDSRIRVKGVFTEEGGEKHLIMKIFYYNVYLMEAFKGVNSGISLAIFYSLSFMLL